MIKLKQNLIVFILLICFLFSCETKHKNVTKKKKKQHGISMNNNSTNNNWNNDFLISNSTLTNNNNNHDWLNSNFISNNNINSSILYFNNSNDLNIKYNSEFEDKFEKDFKFIVSLLKNKDFKINVDPQEIKEAVYFAFTKIKPKNNNLIEQLLLIYLYLVNDNFSNLIKSPGYEIFHDKIKNFIIIHGKLFNNTLFHVGNINKAKTNKILSTSQKLSNAIQFFYPKADIYIIENTFGIDIFDIFGKYTPNKNENEILLLPTENNIIKLLHELLNNNSDPILLKNIASILNSPDCPQLFKTYIGQYINCFDSIFEVAAKNGYKEVLKWILEKQTDKIKDLIKSLDIAIDNNITDKILKQLIKIYYSKYNITENVYKNLFQKIGTKLIKFSIEYNLEKILKYFINNEKHLKISDINSAKIAQICSYIYLSFKNNRPKMLEFYFKYPDIISNMLVHHSDNFKRLYLYLFTNLKKCTHKTILTDLVKNDRIKYINEIENIYFDLFEIGKNNNDNKLVNYILEKIIKNSHQFFTIENFTYCINENKEEYIIHIVKYLCETILNSNESNDLKFNKIKKILDKMIISDKINEKLLKVIHSILSNLKNEDFEFILKNCIKLKLNKILQILLQDKRTYKYLSLNFLKKLKYLVEYPNKLMSKSLLSNSCLIYIKKNEWYEIIKYAIHKENKFIIKFFLENKKINNIDKDGLSELLNLAIDFELTPLVAQIINQYNLKFLTSDYTKIIDYAMAKNLKDIINLFLENKLLIKKLSDADMQKLFFKAIKCENKNLINLFIQFEIYKKIAPNLWTKILYYTLKYKNHKLRNYFNKIDFFNKCRPEVKLEMFLIFCIFKDLELIKKNPIKNIIEKINLTKCKSINTLTKNILKIKFCEQDIEIIKYIISTYKYIFLKNQLRLKFFEKLYFLNFKLQNNFILNLINIDYFSNADFIDLILKYDSKITKLKQNKVKFSHDEKNSDEGKSIMEILKKDFKILNTPKLIFLYKENNKGLYKIYCIENKHYNALLNPKISDYTIHIFNYHILYISYNYFLDIDPKDIKQDEECVICKENLLVNTVEYKELKNIIVMICPNKHIYHYDCIITWINSFKDKTDKPNCPLCRNEIDGACLYNKNHALKTYGLGYILDDEDDEDDGDSNDEKDEEDDVDPNHEDEGCYHYKYHNITIHLNSNS